MQRLLILAMLLGTYACSAGTGATGGAPGSGNGTGGDSGSASLTGNWQGPLTNKGAGTGAALGQPTVKVALTSSTSTTGTFLISLSRDESSQATGTYTILSTTMLLLEVTKSNISTITSVMKLSYVLIGKSLELYNDTIDLTLAQDSAAGSPPNTSTSPNGQPVVQDILVGLWSCSDRAGNAWKVNLRSNASFVIDVSASGNSALWLDGNYTITRGKGDADAVLTVTDSAVAKYKAMELRILQHGDNLVDLQRMGAAAQGAAAPIVETMQCDRLQ